MFFGDLRWSHALEGITLSHRTANAPADAVEMHRHLEAHFVLVTGGRYVSSARGAANPHSSFWTLSRVRRGSLRICRPDGCIRPTNRSSIARGRRPGSAISQAASVFTPNGGQIVMVIPDLDMVVGFNGSSYGEFAKWYRWGLQLVPQYIIPAALDVRRRPAAGDASERTPAKVRRTRLRAALG